MSNDAIGWLFVFVMWGIIAILPFIVIVAVLIWITKREKKAAKARQMYHQQMYDQQMYNQQMYNQQMHNHQMYPPQPPQDNNRDNN